MTPLYQMDTILLQNNRFICNLNQNNMVQIPIHHDLEPQFNFLRELYPWSLLMGEMICLAETLFQGNCEFAKAIKEQDEELATYQWYACIQKLYKIETERLEIQKLGEVIWNHTSIKP